MTQRGTLFLMLINNLSNAAKCNRNVFADDSALYKGVGKEDTVCSVELLYEYNLLSFWWERQE